jgi:hypothetical protein
MKIISGISIGLLVVMTSSIRPAGAADQAVVKAQPAAPVATCSSWNWTHGWLDHGGWGGWGYYDGLAIDGWGCGSADAYAYAPRAMKPVARRAKR